MQLWKEELPKIESPRAIAPAPSSGGGEEVRKQFSNLNFLTENRARTKGTFYGKYAGDDLVKMVIRLCFIAGMVGQYVVKARLEAG